MTWAPRRCSFRASSCHRLRSVPTLKRSSARCGQRSLSFAKVLILFRLTGCAASSYFFRAAERRETKEPDADHTQRLTFANFMLTPVIAHSRDEKEQELFPRAAPTGTQQTLAEVRHVDVCCSFSCWFAGVLGTGRSINIRYRRTNRYCVATGRLPPPSVSHWCERCLYMHAIVWSCIVGCGTESDFEGDLSVQRAAEILQYANTCAYFKLNPRDFGLPDNVLTLHIPPPCLVLSPDRMTATVYANFCLGNRVPWSKVPGYE